MKKHSQQQPNCPEGIISVKVDKPTLAVFARVTQSGLQQQFEDRLFERMYLTSLRSLILKIAKALQRIGKRLTFRFTDAEAFCYRLTVQFWNEINPFSLEVTVSKKYFPLPVEDSSRIDK